MARVLFLDPYHGPSHAALSRTLQARSRHQITLLALPPRKWKWRMRGAALALEAPVRAFPPPDLLIVTDMLNLPETLALLRDHWGARLPVILYFHENQLTYPVSGGDERDLHFGLVNIHSALSADLVLFNSRFHLEDFLGAVPRMLREMPDRRPEGVADRIRSRSQVLGLPIDVPPDIGAGPRDPWILWNHRWEDDKDPAAFFRAMARLEAGGADFMMAVAGPTFREIPACFEAARRDLEHRIAHWGHVPDTGAYHRLLARCRVVVSTARHEFYGLAVREAIALGCRPLLPRRVVYPELTGNRESFLYDTEDDLADRLASVLQGREPDGGLPELRREILALRPETIVPLWDDHIDRLTSKS